MKRLAIPAGVVLAFVMLMTAGAFAKERFAVIHITLNYDESGLYPAECLGTVTLETLPTKKGDPVTWVVLNGNGDNDDDVCTETNGSVMNKGNVSVHFMDNFMDDLMGNAVTDLTAKMGTHKGKPAWLIQGMVDPGAKKGVHHYHIAYKGKQAGPDPEVEVDCGLCGGGGR